MRRGWVEGKDWREVTLVSGAKVCFLLNEG